MASHLSPHTATGSSAGPSNSPARPRTPHTANPDTAPQAANTSPAPTAAPNNAPAPTPTPTTTLNPRSPLNNSAAKAFWETHASLGSFWAREATQEDDEEEKERKRAEKEKKKAEKEAKKAEREQKMKLRWGKVWKYITDNHLSLLGLILGVFGAVNYSWPIFSRAPEPCQCHFVVADATLVPTTTTVTVLATITATVTDTVTITTTIHHSGGSSFVGPVWVNILVFVFLFLYNLLF